MTRLFEKAVEEISKLSKTEQDSIAAVILEEISDAKKWKESFLSSQKGLELLAKEALVEYKSGRTKPLKY
jgi:hypothetical protein